MAERLIIRNFAGIDEIDIELGRINIFIGAQASGKSICVKCISFFKNLTGKLLREALLQTYSFNEVKGQLIQEFLLLFEPSAYHQQVCQLRLSQGEHFIEISGKGSQLVLAFSDVYGFLFDRARKAVSEREANSPEEAIRLDDTVRPRFMQAAEELIGPFFSKIQLFVPASRSIYSLAPTPQTSSAFSKDRFLNDFGVDYTWLRRTVLATEWGTRQPPLVDKLTEMVLRAKFARENEDDYLVQESGLKTPLIYGSSGQQEVLPVLLVLRYLVAISKLPIVAFIEEPEAHLHPTAQNALAQLMAAVYNVRAAPLQLFLTTHTPYLLTAFNNLIYAGQLADTLQDDAAGLAKLDAVVPKELRLHLADFRVYGLENGRATLMIDEETGLLRADSLDSVSDVTADQFGDLMALDPAIHS